MTGEEGAWIGFIAQYPVGQYGITSAKDVISRNGLIHLVFEYGLDIHITDNAKMMFKQNLMDLLYSLFKREIDFSVKFVHSASK